MKIKHILVSQPQPVDIAKTPYADMMKKYGVVEVCVDKANRAALALFMGAGFEDTGYVDPALPECLNLMYTL